MGRSILILVALAALELAGCAEKFDVASLPAARPIEDGTTVAPPAGFVSFCLLSPDACTAPMAVASGVQLNKQNFDLISSVNDRVNNAIIYKSDIDHYGAPNHWTLQPEGGYGDCKDYALSKREALRKAGFPDSALRIAIVRTPEGELHAVLTVDTDKGAVVLDSLTPQIRQWSSTPYRWLERQAADSPLRWVALTSETINGQN